MDYTKKEIAENLEKIRKEIISIEIQSGRPAGSVKLLAVSKFHPVQSVMDAIEAGQTLFGENRIQEAAVKFEEIRQSGKNAELHIIGTLQRNKVKDAVAISSCIESVDRIEVLTEIEKQCSRIDKKITVLFEYHTGEETKAGFLSYEKLLEAVQCCADGEFSHIIPRGFMTMAPYTSDSDPIHRAFARLRETAQKIRTVFPEMNLDILSMGMSNDFKIAIEEGSTLVRIGTAIFGKRN